MTTKILTVPVADREALIALPPVRGLSEEEKRLWLRSRRGLVPTALEISLAPNLGRLEIDYRYAREQGRVGPEIDLTHGVCRAFQRNGLLARAHLRRAGPRRAAKAYAEYAELLKTLMTYAKSLPDDYRNRWRLLATAGLAAEHWKREKDLVSQALVAPSLEAV